MPRPVDIFPHFHILRGVLNEIATERRSHETSNALKEGQQEKGPEQPVVQRPGTGLSTLEKRCFHAEFQNVLAVFPCSIFINFPGYSCRNHGIAMHFQLSATRTSPVYCSCGAWWYWRPGSESRSAKTEALAAKLFF